jgi:hypothetical protein
LLTIDALLIIAVEKVLETSEQVGIGWNGCC